jgi:hypothetical protein
MEGDPGSYWIGSWVGPRAVLDAVVKRKIPSPRRESNSGHKLWKEKDQLSSRRSILRVFNGAVPTDVLQR